MAASSSEGRASTLESCAAAATFKGCVTASTQASTGKGCAAASSFEGFAAPSSFEGCAANCVLARVLLLDEFFVVVQVSFARRGHVDSFSCRPLGLAFAS